MSTAPMGTEPTPLQVTPRFGLSRVQNLARLQQQLIAGGKIAESVRFLEEYERARRAMAGRFPTAADHPITTAARAVGVEVHWVK